MALPWSVPDLSDITSELVAMLQTAVNNSPIPPFNVHVSGSMPETVRKNGDCQLSMYLLHVGRDPYWRNTPRQGPRALPNTQQALSLNLTYLLTAYADADFVAEQQAMSIALHCFHEQPLFHGSNQEFTISIEADTIEEMSRLWQAIAVPIRLSSVIRVGVVFITPTAQPPTVSPPPARAGLVVGQIPRRPAATFRHRHPRRLRHNAGGGDSSAGAHRAGGRPENSSRRVGAGPAKRRRTVPGAARRDALAGHVVAAGRGAPLA